MDTKRYDSLVVPKKTGDLVRREAKKSRRSISVEVEMLIAEAVEARKKSRHLLTPPDCPV